MAFPRVGRSGTIEWNPDENWSNTQKRNNGNNNMNNGLWFGPRLGRLHKRQDYQQENPFSYFYIGGGLLSTPVQQHSTLFIL